MLKKSTHSSIAQPSWWRFVPWLLSGAAVFLAILVWGSSFQWQLAGLSVYQIFPVLGLTAYSIMWSGYMTGFMQRTFLKAISLDAYYRVTSYAVLALIILHPGLLIVQRFRDGFGLPPGSYESYVAPGMAWVTLLGTGSLLIFLAFELHRWLGKKSWWKYVLYLNDAAMLAIFYHGLRLGTQLHIAWFRAIWWFYGVSLVGVLLYTYISKIAVKRQTGSLAGKKS